MSLPNVVLEKDGWLRTHNGCKEMAKDLFPMM